jgi:phosphate butyryltransferase
MSVSSFDELIRKVQEENKNSRKKVAVMCADDEEVLLALAEARDKNIADSYLVGNEENIRKIAGEKNINLKGFNIINSTNVEETGKICTTLIREGKASVMMKGLVGTADYMRAILNKEHGLRSGNLISHIALFDLPTYHKLLLVTDAAVNIRPNLDEKVAMINNAKVVMNSLGIEKPKVAVVTAVEKINPEKMPATLDADLLSKKAKSGEIKGVFVDGPFALDVAISKHAARVKSLDKLEVAGDADIILSDDIESGNMLYKALCNFGQGKSAAIVAGAKAPVVLTSRSDTHESKFLSIVFAIAVSL